MRTYTTGPTGGLFYHYLAWRRGGRAWREFRSELRAFLLEDWNPQARELIVVGPSAGWTLPEELFGRFKKVIVVEPDPVARFLLRRRWPKTEFIFDSSDERLPWLVRARDRSRDPAKPLLELVERHPDAAILFANVLGQIPLLLSANFSHDDHRVSREAFLAALRSRNWASYHDVFSSAMTKEASPLAVPSEAMVPVAARSVDELARLFFHDGRDVIDHETSWLSELFPTRYLIWPFDQTHHHVIGLIAPHSP